jgi:hypothetical protein
MLKFVVVAKALTIVYLGDKHIGQIDKAVGGYQYTPKGKKPGGCWSGELMATEALVRESLRSE